MILHQLVATSYGISPRVIIPLTEPHHCRSSRGYAIASCIAVKLSGCLTAISIDYIDRMPVLPLAESASSASWISWSGCRPTAMHWRCTDEAVSGISVHRGALYQVSPSSAPGATFSSCPASVGGGLGRSLLCSSWRSRPGAVHGCRPSRGLARTPATSLSSHPRPCWQP